MAATDSIGLQPAGLPRQRLSSTPRSATRITDYGTLRVRGGWMPAAFMPYGFVGVALARADVARSATVTLVNLLGSPLPYFTADRATDSQTGAFAYGYAAGFGVDIASENNLFVRGEYEYVQFGAFNDINMHIHTARIGAGLKF